MGKRQTWSGFALLFLPSVAIMALGLAPLLVVVTWSVWSWDPASYWISPDINFDSYAAIFDAGRWTVIVATLGKAALCAAISVVLGYPVAFTLHFLVGRRLSLALLALITIPFFTSYLIRSFAWRLVLGRNGAINSLLLSLGMIDQPIEWLLFSDFAIIVGLVAAYLPFAIFPILLSFSRLNGTMIAAAQDLGANLWQVLGTIILPLTKPGIAAGFLFVFVLVAGSSTEVQMLGGAGATIVTVMINDVMRVANYPLAFAISTLVLSVIACLVLISDGIFGLTAHFGDTSE